MNLNTADSQKRKEKKNLNTAEKMKGKKKNTLRDDECINYITDIYNWITLTQFIILLDSLENIYTFYVRDDEYSSVYKIILTSFSEDSVGPTINVLSIYLYVLQMWLLNKTTR